MKRLFLLFTLCTLVLLSCKREKSSWDVDIVAPIVWGEFGIADLIGDSAVSTNVNNFLSITVDEELLNVKPDTLASVSDTILVNNYTLPEGLSAYNLDPGSLIPIITDRIVLNPGSGIELKEAHVEHGSFTFNMFNPVATPIVVSYTLPGVKLEGEPLSLIDTLPQGTTGAPSITSREVVLDNYIMDLTGVDGATVNELTQEFSAANSLDGNSIVFLNTDTLKFQMELNDLTFSYAKGYFGSISVNESGDFDLTELADIPSNALVLNEAAINLEIRNGLGIDFQLLQSEYVAENIVEEMSLSIVNDELTNTINIDRALDSGNEPIYNSVDILLDESNSNIVDLVSLSPETFEFSFDAELNPFGNISLSNDFIYSDHGIIINAEVDIPLCLTLNDLSLQDSIQFNLDDSGDGTVRNGELQLFFENQFPFDLTIDMTIASADFETNDIILTDELVASCDLDDDCSAVASEIAFDLSTEQFDLLKNGGYVILMGTFNSVEEIKLTAEQKLKFRAVLDGVVTVGE